MSKYAAGKDQIELMNRYRKRILALQERVFTTEMSEKQIREELKVLFQDLRSDLVDLIVNNYSRMISKKLNRLSAEEVLNIVLAMFSKVFLLEENGTTFSFAKVLKDEEAKILSKLKARKKAISLGAVVEKHQYQRFAISLIIELISRKARNVLNLETMRLPQNPVKWIEFRTVSDDRVTSICKQNHNESIQMKYSPDRFPDRLIPQSHYGCRCVLIPHLN